MNAPAAAQERWIGPGIGSLDDINARVLPSADEPDVVRFQDNNGITVEVRVAE